MNNLKTITNLKDWFPIRKELGVRSLGFVPTMGALHEGHLSLIAKSKKENQITLVSIFLNPTQFNNKNDLKNYPIDIDGDLKELNQAGVDYVILPTYEHIYPDNFKYKVVENDLSQQLCGLHRPGHFDGVLTVVLKLLNIANPTRAYFGMKDYQQYKLIELMCKAFFLSVEIIACETIRESDGLAMSSRNKLLNPEARKIAAKFASTLKSPTNFNQVREKLENEGMIVDYVEEKFGRRFGAVNIGSVRLIDNVEL